jgi:hypothetical protein
LLPLFAFEVISSSDKVSSSGHGTKASSYVAAVGLAIPKNDTVTENAIILLLDLGGLSNGWSKVPDIVWGVDHGVELWLDGDLCWINLTKCIQDVVNQNAKIGL